MVFEEMTSQRRSCRRPRRQFTNPKTYQAEFVECESHALRHLAESAEDALGRSSWMKVAPC